MNDARLRMTKPVFSKYVDSGGMFDDKLCIYYDTETDEYLALATDGWGRGYGKRYPTLQEAKDNLDRLHQKL